MRLEKARDGALANGDAVPLDQRAADLLQRQVRLMGDQRQHGVPMFTQARATITAHGPSLACLLHADAAPGDGPASRAVPRRGGAASDRAHGPRRHDARFLTHRTLKGAGRVGDDRGTGFLAHSCLAVLPSGETLGLAHQTIWARPPKGVTPQTRESAVWAETVETIGRPPAGSLLSRSADRGADIFAHLESVRDAGWDAVVRAAQERRLVQGGGSLTALRAARAMGAASILTKTGEAVVCVAWRELELLPPRNGPQGRAPIRVGACASGTTRSSGCC